MEQIKANVMEFIDAAADLPAQDKAAKLALLSKLFREASAFSEDKVKVAIETYDIVEKHVRRLDEDLRKFEEEQMTVPKQPADKKLKRPARRLLVLFITDIKSDSLVGNSAKIKQATRPAAQRRSAAAAPTAASVPGRSHQCFPDTTQSRRSAASPAKRARKGATGFEPTVFNASPLCPPPRRARNSHNC